ncbi:MBL fold metallo-hydrolase [Alkalibacter saccharofermentans]|uniref:L-ascorbate metabolism protein UlaG, beta-lactamase superfamily n=1 Tax=Alkalibacter saccharofermentans DSM 14828 TaxID=1120975 RepID=A0A1M4WD22_9FIRM|nr:MBL fold metallo-hydrolase [Alkalibacter saccharofermentans]SHE79050.1 L-ascorbate metabolism protein UlaG, beta-lactamase superfamily [Alkalibacter saccharofermentans DSM 14828]
MRITFYGYNTFLIKSGVKKVLIDPGGDFYLFKGWLKSLIPQSQWAAITHILVTHGDPDHYWHVDRIAEKSGAPVICNETMVQEINAKRLLLGPRARGLAFTTEIKNLYTIAHFETLIVDGIEITGIKTVHGPLKIKLGPFSKTLQPGPNKRIGWGSIGFEIRMDKKVIVNLGDTLIHRDEWKTISSPDVLMIPIGGGRVHNTMDEKEALEVAEIIKPRLVIPCHYNCAGLHKKNANPANEKYFYDEVKKLGVDCVILRKNESIEI